jgi:hypothetical protein
MSFYEILGVTPLSSDDEIKNAANSCKTRLHIEAPEEFKEKTIAYINSIATLLLSPEGRQCYDSILSTSGNYVSPLRASLIIQRIHWYNSVSDVRFGESFLEELRNRQAQTIKHTALIDYKDNDELKCRWCDRPLCNGNIHTTICNCDSRSGHYECVKLFMRKHKRCPVCRTKLLLRQRVSKYMFFNKNPRYIVG